jgi:DNA-binding response OmpR family regulator
MTLPISALARPASARSWRILIVDDHAESRLSTCHALALCGHVCFTAVTAGAAMEAIDEFKPEAVVLEWRLAGDRGRGLASALRARSAASSRKLIVLVVSTSDEPDGFRDLESIDAYFTKPISMIRIAEWLAVLESRSR